MCLLFIQINWTKWKLPSRIPKFDLLIIRSWYEMMFFSCGPLNRLHPLSVWCECALHQWTLWNMISVWKFYLTVPTTSRLLITLWCSWISFLLSEYKLQLCTLPSRTFSRTYAHLYASSAGHTHTHIATNLLKSYTSTGACMLVLIFSLQELEIVLPKRVAVCV